jgi:hypothetical protein
MHGWMVASENGQKLNRRGAEDAGEYSTQRGNGSNVCFMHSSLENSQNSTIVPKGRLRSGTEVTEYLGDNH